MHYILFGPATNAVTTNCTGGLSETEIFSIGCLPTKLSTWAEEPEFTPVPLSYEIQPMDKLFKKPEWHQGIGNIPLTQGDDDGEKLNSTLIANFFLDKVQQYCKIVMGLATCPKEEKGCGLNSLCPAGTDCVNTGTRHGFICHSRGNNYYNYILVLNI